jgi:hypothetical protein
MDTTTLLIILIIILVAGGGLWSWALVLVSPPFR